MKRRRSTVSVCPGKDVTLYVPTDTPPKVIDYMNQLKADGVFSQGVMDILIKHILHEKMVSTTIQQDETTIEPLSHPDDPVILEEPFDSPKHFSPDEIFRQASRNAGKLQYNRS